jgi:hypothetical protein
VGGAFAAAFVAAGRDTGGRFGFDQLLQAVAQQLGGHGLELARVHEVEGWSTSAEWSWAIA